MSEKETVRHFDESCLAVPEELGPKEIKALRESYHVSQPVFSRYLNTSESTVEKWEFSLNSGRMLLLYVNKRAFINFCNNAISLWMRLMSI